MKKIFVLFGFLLVGLWSAQKSNEDSLQFRKIFAHTMVKGKAYDDLRELTKGIGHRLSGSEAYEKSVLWAEKKLKEAGADKVWLQPVKIPVWVREKEKLEIKTDNGGWKAIKMLSLGNSEGTNGKDLVADLLVVQTIEEFEKLSADEVKGKAVLFNYPYRQDFVTTGEGYGDASKYRRITPALVAKKGGVAVLVRSLTPAFDDFPHTGATRYEEGVLQIPAVAVGVESSVALAKMANNQKIKIRLNSNCGMKGMKDSYSVIGELTGKKDNSVIVVGAHLDSWDVGEGAHDDGTGVVQAIEVLRTFKNLAIPNQHTIRVVLFANEENGVKGGYAYADHIQATQEKHLFAIESDSGGFTPRGIAMDMDAEKRKQIKSWRHLFLPYGIYDFERTGSGVDIGPMKKFGIPLAGLSPDSQRYFDLHHTEADVFEAVNRRELLLGASTMTKLIYMIDKYW